MRKYASSRSAIRRRGRWFPFGLSVSRVFCAASLLTGIAFAQTPTEEQRNEVRAACRSDFIAQCSGVQPGGMEALNCLQQHDSTLSAACRKAVSAITAKPKSTSAEPSQTAPVTTGAATPAPAPAAGAQTAAQPTEAQRDAVKSACRSDFMAQCSGVTPGGAAALSCLQQHSAGLSAPCQQAVAAISAAGAPAAGAGAGAATAATPPATRPAAMPVFSPREEMMIVRETCGPDFRAFCRMVPIGGGRVISCLRDNLQRVSPACHRVLTSGL